MLSKYIYTLFLGILLMTFTTVAISSFYPAPDYPDEEEASLSLSPPQPPKDSPMLTTFQMASPDLTISSPTGVPIRGKVVVNPTLMPMTQTQDIAKQQKKWDRYYKEQREYTEKVQMAAQKAEVDYDNSYDTYVETSLMLHIGIAVLMLLIGLMALRKFPVLSDGIALGGALLLVYHLGKSLWEGGYGGFEIHYTPITVTVIAVATLLTLVVGYVRFHKE